MVMIKSGDIKVIRIFVSLIFVCFFTLNVDSKVKGKITADINSTLNYFNPQNNVTSSSFAPPENRSKTSKNQLESNITCPEDISTYTDLNACDAFISDNLNLIFPEDELIKLTWEMTGATEDKSPNTGINQIDEHIFNEGSTFITYTATDKSNSITTCTFTVTISDNQVPRLENVPSNITVSTDVDECFATVFWNEPSASDNCTPDYQIRKTATYRSGDRFPVGRTVVEYRAYDAMGNESATRSFTITVEDTRPPVLSLPSSITLTCGETIPEPWQTVQQIITAGGSVSDNCGVNSFSFKLYDETRDAEICPYTIARTYQLADNNGNITTARHLIYVEGTPDIKEVVPGLKSAMTDFTATQSGNWSDPATWGGSGPPGSTDNVTIPVGITVTVNGLSTCNNIILNGSLNHSGTTTLQVNGDWTNNGTYDGATNDGAIEFAGSGVAAIFGSTIFNRLIISKGSLNTSLTINGTNSVSTGGSFTFNSGKITIPVGGSFSINHAAGFTIPQTAGFDLTGGTFSTGNLSITNEGLIRISAGTANFGTASGNEVHTQVDGAFIVTGGNVNISGRLFNSASGTLSPPGVTSGISISGGTVTLSTVGNGLSSVGSLNVTSAGNFNFTGGTIIFQNPSTAATELDLGLLSGGGTKTTVGGTFQFGNASTPANSTFNISSDIPLDEVTSSVNADLVLESNVLINDLNLNGATTIDLNGFALQQEVTGTGTYIFPIDDGSGNNIPVTINLTSGSGFGSGDYIEVLTTDNKHPNNANTSNYLSRYWTINTSGIISPVYNVTLEYPTGDITGTESNIAMGVWDSSLPWIKYNTINTGANTISANAISGTSTMVFTGITLADPTVEINGGNANEEICFGGSGVVLNAVPTGDLGWTYSWSPSTGLSATNISNPTANPSEITSWYCV